MMSVQSSLVMYPDPCLWQRGAARKVPAGLAHGDLIGCFGLTEPDAGIDPAAMKTRAEKIDGGYRLTGAKMWISNSPIADVFVVWAKSDAHDGKIRGFVLEKGQRGFSAPKIEGKLVLARLVTGEIVHGRCRGRRGRAAAQRRRGSRGLSAASTGRATASPGA